MDDRFRHAEEFYTLLDHLEHMAGGKRVLKECDGRMGWPEQGVYFFFEPGEYRQKEPGKLRVVRVGTHAVSRGSKSTLWGRLRAHRGTKNGGGNHRGSVFRLHVGAALIVRSQGAVEVPTWAQGQSASKEIKSREREHERRVSQYIGQMPFLWVGVDDEPGPESDRAFIEKHAIALLAGADGASPIDPPSKGWLGRYSPNRKIRESGLWNLNFVGEPEKSIIYNPDFLEVLALYIDRMISK
jgi:hypothetical protein